MKGLVWVISLATLAVLAALVLQDFHGNVVILVPPYRADMGLAAFALALLLLFIALLGLLKLLSSVLSLPALAAQYRLKRAEDSARNALAQSVVDLTAGRFSRAFAAARSAMHIGTLAPAAHLLAAQAAHRLNNHTERDALLGQAIEDPRSKDAALLASAQASLDDRDPLKARATLAQLGSGPARRVRSLRLKLEAARGASDHDEVIRIAQLLHKHGDLTLTAARALTEHAATAKINNSRHDADRLRIAWKEIENAGSRSASLLQEGMPRLVAMAARQFASLGAVPRARELLSAAIDSAAPEQRESLFSAMADMSVIAKSGRASDSTPAIDAGSLAKLERWCAQNPRSAAAALAAGSACAELELWGKARVFLKDCARLDTVHSPSGRSLGTYGQRASTLLAGIEERLGDTGTALELYRSAAQAMVKIAP